MLLSLPRREEIMELKKLHLKWSQAKALKEQIEVAQTVREMSTEGAALLDNGCTISWSPITVTIEIPNDDPE